MSVSNFISSTAEVTCNVDGAMVSVPTNEECCVTSSGTSYEQSSYTIPCIGRYVHFTLNPIYYT